MVKMVINSNFGGFGCDVAEEFKYLIYQYRDDRFALELVKFVEEHPEDCGGLVVVGVCEGFTDYYIEEYDGSESVIYVLDGKIHWAEEIEEKGE